MIRGRRENGPTRFDVNGPCARHFRRKTLPYRIEGQQMKKLQMKKLVGTVLFTSLCAGLVLAQPLETPSNDPAAVDAVKQVGQDMGDAMVAGDIDKLNKIFADDWATVDSSGKIFTKASLLSDSKSGKHKLEWFENGPVDVQVFGDVAVVQGSVKEKRIHDGKDISGQFVFMDLLKKRGDKWVIVRTLGAKVI